MNTDLSDPSQVKLFRLGAKIALSNKTITAGLKDANVDIRKGSYQHSLYHCIKEGYFEMKKHMIFKELIANDTSTN